MGELALAQRALFEGEIAVLFLLSGREVASNVAPPPLLMMLPRMGYFHLHSADLLRKFFLPYSLPHEDEMWFEYDGIPIKWFLPIGVLNDVMFFSLTTLVTPWPITVHFQNFPSTLPRFFSLGSDRLRHVYFQILKQSLYLRFGSITSLLEMKKSSQDLLWECLSTRSLDFFQLLKAIVVPFSTTNDMDLDCELGQGSSDYEDAILLSSTPKVLKSLPVRVFLTGALIYSQRPFAPSAQLTIYDYLLQLYNVGASRVVIEGLILETTMALELALDIFVNVDGWLYISIKKELL